MVIIKYKNIFISKINMNILKYVYIYRVNKMS